MKIHLHGQIQDSTTAGLSPLDRGFTLGDGLFETMQAKDGKILHLNDHLKRLRHGTEILKIPFPDTEAELEQALLKTLAANHLTDAILRLTLTRGIGVRGLKPPPNVLPTLMITAAPLPDLSVLMAPARLTIATCTRRNEYSPLSSIKTLNYLDNILAFIEAEEKGYDDAILLNTKTYITEATTANLFAVLDGELVTPPLTDGVLPGTTRARLIKKRGAKERSLTQEDLHKATEIFLTNAIRIRPVVEIDGVKIVPGKMEYLTSY